jgi:hypothetical protein
VPQNLAGRRLEGDQIPRWVAAENESAACCKDTGLLARSPALLLVRVFPLGVARFVIDRHQVRSKCLFCGRPCRLDRSGPAARKDASGVMAFADRDVRLSLPGSYRAIKGTRGYRRECLWLDWNELSLSILRRFDSANGHDE